MMLVPALAACGGRTTDSGQQAADSVDVEMTMEELMLPDTSYASVEAVKYVVENADSAAHPLKDFDDRYQKANGVFAFRKNLMRNADFGGTVQGTPKSIEIAWEFTTDYDTTHTRFGVWGGGSGWTGQPLYVHWTDEQMAAFRQQSPGLTPDFGPEEIIVGSLCGKGYFINYQTGRASRQPLDLGNVVKGTVSLDPEYYNLYVGQGVPRKAGPFGCQAFDLLKRETELPHELVIAGGQGWKFSADDALLGIAAAKKVHFIGYVADEDISALYSAADLFAFPTLYEGFGIPILEAQQCGTPVLTSNISAMPEVGGSAAFYVNPYDEAEITHGMEKLLVDQSVREDLIQKGYLNAKRFSWETSAKQLCQMTERLFEK